MQLKIKKEMRKSIIYLDLETINFCSKESKYLDQFGEPVISFEKMYGQFPVSINKKIRSNFKVRVKFDGTDDINAAVLAVEQFIEEIKLFVVDEMDDFMFKSDEISFSFTPGIDNSDSTNHQGHGDVKTDFYHPYYPR